MSYKNLKSFRPVIILSIVILFCFIFPKQLSCQVLLTNWKIYTSLLYPVDATMDSQGRLWIATSGGVYLYDLVTKKIVKELRNLEGLSTLNITAIKADTTHKKIYIGGNDGSLVIFDENFNSFQDNTIKNTTDYPNLIINDFYITDSIVYVAGGFGLTSFYSNQSTNDSIPIPIIQTISKFNKFQSNTNTRKIFIKNHKIWVGTDEGIAVADIDTMDTPHWKNYGVAEGLSDPKIFYIIENNDTIYAASSDNIYYLNDSTFNTLFTEEDYSSITGLESHGDSVFFASHLHYLLAVPFSPIYPHGYGFGDWKIPFNISKYKVMTYKNDEFSLFLDSCKGIYIFHNNGYAQIDSIKPNSPYTSLFSRISIDNSNNIWVSGNGGTGGGGVYYYDGSEWTNFNDDTYPFPGLSSADDVKALPDGRIFITTWGPGFFIANKTDSGYFFKNYNSSNCNILPPSLVSTDICTDSKSNVWFPLYESNGSKSPLLIEVDKNNSVKGINNCFSPSVNNYYPLVIDQNDTKWLGATDGDGLYGLNENYPSNNCVNILTSNSQILNNIQSALAVDKNGSLWIGCGDGISVLNNPSYFFYNGIPIIRQSIASMADKYIYALMVDALNNIWVGTNVGLWILDNDGNQLNFEYGGKSYDHLNSTNSIIPDDNIQSLSTNENNGKVYIGTKSGMVEVQTLAIRASDNYSISIYPQPFYSGSENQLMIEGLAAESDIRILTTDGVIIKNFSTVGNVAVWDGKDNFGDVVSSGVYILLANSLSKNQSTVAKIAVIRGNSPK